MSSDVDTSLVFFNTKQLADLLGVPRSTVEYWRGTGAGPRYSRLGRHVRYAAADVRDWAEENRNATR